MNDVIDQASGREAVEWIVVFCGMDDSLGHGATKSSRSAEVVAIHALTLRPPLTMSTVSSSTAEDPRHCQSATPRIPARYGDPISLSTRSKFMGLPIPARHPTLFEVSAIDFLHNE